MIKKPLPPSFMLTILHNNEAYIEKYFTVVKGYYNTGDSGYYDEDGYFYVMSR
jgi:propionyl-CoA synthetase